jgi:hypothetical protein
MAGLARPFLLQVQKCGLRELLLFGRILDRIKPRRIEAQQIP